MLKQTSLFVAGAALCLSSWANNITGTYQCSMIQNDKLKTGEVIIAEKNHTYSSIMKWQDEQDAYQNLLKTTSSHNRFIQSWSSENAVGIAEWVFDKDSLKSVGVTYLTHHLGKHEDVINCMKKK